MEGLNRIIRRVRLKWFQITEGRRFDKDLRNMQGLIKSQQSKGIDLYDGIEEEDRLKLTDLKHRLLTYLVKKNYYQGNYKKSIENADKKWESYISRLNVKPNVFRGKSVLEVGSGHSAALYKCGGYEIVNVDPLMDIYIHFIDGFPNLFSEINFIKAFSEKIPFENNRFDIIVCVNAFDHFDSVPMAIKEITRLLKPAGLLLLSVDCKDRTKDRLEKVVGHPYSFTPEKLHHLFRQTGLQLVFQKENSEAKNVTMHFSPS